MDDLDGVDVGMVGGDPEVGTARVGLHGERLQWCTDGDVDPVLQASVAV